MNRKKLLSLFLALVMVLSAFPISAFAAPATDIPDKMLDNPIVRALAYTGYNVQKQKDNGTIYQTGHYGGALKRNAPSILSDIHYSTSLSGKETVSDSSTVTGKAPNIARFEQYGLCCASFVTYYICNYLPNIEGVDTQFITDAINATGTNSQAVVTWQNALNKLASQGKVEKVGTSPSNVDYSKLTPGDIIIFGNSSSSHVHAAIFAGVYDGKHFIIHVGNERGPEINTTEGMAHSSNGDKASTPNGYYHLPDELFIENGFMEVKKTDENGKALAGAVFVATNQKTGKAYKIGPTNASGYAKAADPIPFGTYTVKETVFPKDYRAYGKSEWTVTLNKNTPNATITIKAVNELIPGSAKIVKVSEDGKVDGITFRIQGNGIDKTVKTANGGVIQVDNLKPGVYTVTETEYDKYIPQEVRRVTVVSGQVSTVNFSNKLRRGDLTVKKTAEDGLTEGMKFRLYGTSLSGIEVNEYAVTDKNGVAKFKDVLIGTGYTIEEVDTPTRYVVPEKQTAAIEWNKVTNKSFDNILKKFNVTVTKSDSEKGLPQGDASLAGAKYGIYKGNQLIDTYTTDANGQFTTKYYICGNDWSLKEISPSEGYLINTESQHIGAEAKLYTVEYNLAKPLDSLEDVIKGKIAVIKHCDDGTTKIETPEKGAEFEVYLKAAGSYENAEETERDILVCDENGFAETKDLPYGEYTVKQTKGWEGKELLAPFNVFVKENGKTYRFLINNATFEALIEIVKKDAETGKIIPASGIGFKVRNTDTGEYIVQHINYPTPMDIDTYYTDVTGKLMMPDKLPYGNYEIIEQCTAYGYVLDSAPIAFKVDGSKTVVTVEKHNMPQKGIVNISKSGEVFFSAVESDGVYSFVFADKGLAGAVYEITAAEDIITPDGTLRYAKGTVVDTVTTDENGSAASGTVNNIDRRSLLASYGIGYDVSGQYGFTWDFGMRTWTAGDQKIPVFGYVLTNLRAAPPIPTLTGVSVTDNQSAKITWKAPTADLRRPYAGYHIWMRMDDGEFERVTEAPLSAEELSYTYTSLQADTTYTFAVSSVTDKGMVSALSNTKTFSTFAGADGREIEFRSNGSSIQWRYAGESDDAYRDLVSLAELTGNDGADGKQIELRVYNGFVQWKYSDDSVWNNLIALSELKGEKGDKGDTGDKGDKGDKGDPGQDGKDGITPRLKIGEDNLWYVSYDGGQTWVSLGVKATGEKGDTGKDGQQGEKGDKGDKGDPGDAGTPGQNGKNGTSGADGKNGKDGKDGIGIAKAEINADGELVITYTDGKTVNLGKVVGADGKDGLTPFIGENGNWWIGEKDTGVKAVEAAVPAGSGNISASSPALIVIGSVAGLALLGNLGLILYIVLKKKKSLV